MEDDAIRRREVDVLHLLRRRRASREERQRGQDGGEEEAPEGHQPSVWIRNVPIVVASIS